MKQLFTIASLLCLSLCAKAQNTEAPKADAPKKFQFGAGLSVGLPVGTFNDTHGAGVGVDVQVTYHHSDQIKGFAQIGYASFKGKDFGFFKMPSISAMPILIGGRYYMGPVSAGLGLGYGNLSSDGESEGGFAFSPQAGYDFKKFQALAYYTNISSDGEAVSFMGVKLLYNF